MSYLVQMLNLGGRREEGGGRRMREEKGWRGIVGQREKGRGINTSMRKSRQRQ